MLYFIYCLLLFIMDDRSWLRARAILFKRRPIFVMLTSSVRLCCVLHFEAPEWFLVCWQIAPYSYMSPLGFLAVNMELFGTTRQVPSFGI
jgi:hypothetical protein